MTTFPKNTVTGAPQNFLHRVSRKAACGPRSPGALGASVNFSNWPPWLHRKLFSISKLSGSCRSSRSILCGASSLKEMRFV